MCFESTSVYNIIILSRTRMRKGIKNTQGSTFACFTLLWMILTIKDVFRIFNFSFVFIIRVSRTAAKFHDIGVF